MKDAHSLDHLFEITEDELKQIKEWEIAMDARIYKKQVEAGHGNRSRFLEFLDAFGKLTTRESGEVPLYGAIGGAYEFQFRFLKKGYSWAITNSMSKEVLELVNEHIEDSGSPDRIKLFSLDPEEIKQVMRWQESEQGQGEREDYIYQVCPTGVWKFKTVINTRNKVYIDLIADEDTYKMVCPNCREINTVMTQMTPFGSSVSCLWCSKPFRISGEFYLTVNHPWPPEKKEAEIVLRDKEEVLDVKVESTVSDKKLNILLVEDDPNCIRLYTEEIEERFEDTVKVVVCRQGFDALGLLSKENDRIHMIVCEVKLADMYGADFIRECKRKYPHITLVVNSCRDMSDNIAACHPDRYIVKTADLSVLMNAIKHFLKRFWSAA